MASNPHKYILLNHRDVEYCDGGWLASITIPFYLPRGAILERSPEQEQPEDPDKITLRSIDIMGDIKLTCSLMDVGKIKDNEADLLLAVWPRKERFRVYRERNLLCWVNSLTIGSRVMVKLYNKDKVIQGVIRYKGPLPTCKGTRFGVELLDQESRGLGTTDGTFENKKYFDCKENCGVFVVMDKLSPPDQDQVKETTFLSTIKKMMSSFSSKDDSHVRVIAKDHKIKINQRVVVFPEDDHHHSVTEPLRGTVRYISEQINDCGDCPVGIELDEKKGSGTGMWKGRQRFVCKKDYAMFVPVVSLITEEDFDGSTTGNSQNSSSSKTDALCSSQEHNDVTERQLSRSEQRFHDLEFQLYNSEQRSHELESSLAAERQAREETERDLRRSEQRSHDLELQLHNSEQKSHEFESSLATERKAKEQREASLRSSVQRSRELEASLATERQAKEQTEASLRSSVQRSRELVASLATERQAKEQTKASLRSSVQRSRELEASLATERQAREQTEASLRNSVQRSREFESSLATERQVHGETARRLQSNAERLHELETTLATLRQAYEACRRSQRESIQDWVLDRDEIRVSDITIGRGAWGKVTEGTFRGCKVAVKEIHELILSDHNRRLFDREMNMASRCRHPCLLQFIGATNDEQSPLFVTEQLDTSLRAVLHERPLEPPEITTIALDVAKGLNYLHLSHPAPIIHRDIGSANVLLWKHVTIWRAKVSDYGTANFLQQSMTVTPGAVVYSAPEAQTSRQSPKLDVYSFGVLLCEMNIGEMPDVDQRDEQVALVINDFFRTLIRSCLKQNPEERPSMAEIIETLETFVQ